MVGLAMTPLRISVAVLVPLALVAVTVIVVDAKVAGTEVALMAQVEELMV